MFESSSANRRLINFYNVNTLEGFGNFNRVEMSVLSAILEYLNLTQKGILPILKTPIREPREGSLNIDSFTRKNLELTLSLSGEKAGSLLNIINKTVTAAGARMLESRLSNPSTNIELIKNRQDDVQYFVDHNKLRKNTQKK